MSIHIPQKLKDLLAADNVWLAKVTKLMENVEPILTTQPEFFPDYTIHGEGHINEVLHHVDELINSRTQKILTSRDVAFLIAAVVIHDLGMFIAAPGFRKLLQENNDWQTQWNTFVEQAKRYTEEKMLYCFGTNIAVNVLIPPADQMTRYDRLVVGEFLRQNHADLAHKIAKGVMYGDVDQDIFRDTGFKTTERDMIGLLARSHGMAIRETEDYFQTNFGDDSCPFNTPVYYLMAVLRIADYLDAGEHRAPVSMENLRGIPVPVSLEEWSWNQCIDPDACKYDIRKNNYRIYAEPESSIAYVQLDKWLKRVQAELDLSWSVIAEKYPDDPYRLSIHRVVCNIHQPGVRDTMNSRFLTEKVKITANPEITKLMIAPLYGDNPTFGVRELLQNSVDACLERKDKEAKKEKPSDYNGLVTISIDSRHDLEDDKEMDVFTIEDNGIGMNAHVLMNYYLSAGASYRSSEEWKMDYTVDGKSSIARTGQFGVGFLAAFLLGDRVSVTTQHMNDEKGYTFEFTNKSKPLNITRVKRDKGVGTTIQIVLKSGALNQLKEERHFPWYNWYAFDDPEVRYFLNGEQINHEEVSLSRDPSYNPEWFCLASNTFDSYLWHPRMSQDSSVCGRSSFYCNGIRVYGTNLQEDEDDGLQVPFPHVSVVDHNTSLDIDLARRQLQTFPEYESLLREVFKYHIARLLMTSWETETDYSRNFNQGFCLYFSGSDRIGVPFLVTQGGFSLHYVSVLSIMDIQQLGILYYGGFHTSDAVGEAYRSIPPQYPISIFAADTPFCELETMPEEEIRRYLFKFLREFESRPMNNRKPLFGRNSLCYSLHRHISQVRILDSIPEHAAGVCLRSIFRGIEIDRNTYIARRRSIDRSQSEEIQDNMPDINTEAFPITIQINIERHDEYFVQHGSPKSLFPQMLREYLGPNDKYPDRDMWIPFDMDARREKFPEAFEDLEPYFDYIRRYPIL